MKLTASSLLSFEQSTTVVISIVRSTHYLELVVWQLDFCTAPITGHRQGRAEYPTSRRTPTLPVDALFCLFNKPRKTGSDLQIKYQHNAYRNTLKCLANSNSSNMHASYRFILPTYGVSRFPYYLNRATSHCNVYIHYQTSRQRASASAERLVNMIQAQLALLDCVSAGIGTWASSFCILKVGSVGLQRFHAIFSVLFS